MLKVEERRQDCWDTNLQVEWKGIKDIDVGLDQGKGPYPLRQEGRR